MEGKLHTLMEAYRRYDYDQAARLADDLSGKKDKGKAKLTEEQDMILAAVRSGSLLRLGRYGQAQKAIEAANLPSMKQLDLLSIFMDTACELKLSGQQQELVALLEKQKDKEKYAQQQGKEYPLLRYYISMRRFGDASKYCLKLYDQSKSELHFLWQISLEFVQLLAKNGLTMQKREELLKSKPGLPLQLILMFWQKFVGLFPLQQLIQQQKSCAEDAVRFYVRLLITQYKFPQAVEALKRFGSALTDPIVVTNLYRSIYNLEAKQEYRDILIAHYESLFRSNMYLEKYHPLYDLYRDYLGLLVKEVLKAETLQLSLEVGKAARFNTQQIGGDKLSHYVSSLASEYHDNIQPNATTKLDFYSTSLKTLLGQILESMNYVKHPQRGHYLQEYIRHFGKTYTFAVQFVVLCPQGCEISQEQPAYSVESKRTFDVNVRKLNFLWKKQPLPSTVDQLQDVFREYFQLYEDCYKEVDSERKLEKGQRLTADQYIVVLSDIYREYFENNPQQPLNEPVINIILLLMHASKRSPYNYSLKLRLYGFFRALNLNDRILNLYETLDIKSVQFETLGYFIYPGMQVWGQEKEYQELLMRAIRSYQDNTREIKMYSYKSLERGRIMANLEEFLSYDDFTERSYARIVLLVLLANKHKGSANERYFLQEGVKMLLREQKQEIRFTFSSDYLRLESTVNRERQICSFFGIHNSPELLLNEFQLRLEQLDLMQEKFDGRQTELLDVPFEKLLDFGRFEYLREPYRYRPVKSLQETILLKSFNSAKLLQQLQLAINKLARSILTKQEVDPNRPTELGVIIQQLQHFRKDPRQLMTLQRKLPYSIILIKNALSTLSSKKKKKEQQKKLAENLRNLLESIYQLICDFQDKLTLPLQQAKLWQPLLQPELKDLSSSFTRLQKLVSTTAKQYDNLHRIG